MVEEEKRNNLPEARTHVQQKKSKGGLREKSVETLGSVARRTRSLSDRFENFFFFSNFRFLCLCVVHVRSFVFIIFFG